MAEKYAGSAVLEVNGVEIEITDLNVTKQTGRKLVKTMNSEGRARGFAKGIATWELSLTAALPIDGSEIDWAEIIEQIGRAVQQECRDRSRMPSSA